MTMPFIIGASQQKRSGRPFIIKVNYASGFTVTLPLYNYAGYNYNFIVDWGDGSVGQITSATDSYRVHTYSAGGTYTIKMTGTLEGWLGNATGLKEYIVEVSQWGRTGFKMISMQSCTRLVACYGILQTTYLTALTQMFYGCNQMVTCEVADWDISTITSLGGVFYGCSKVTQLDVSNWDVSNVTVLWGAFFGNAALTSLDVSNWNVTKVTSWQAGNNTGVFQNCTGLTSLDTSSWVFNSSNDLNVSLMFRNCANLVTIKGTSGWNTGRFIAMGAMFYACSKLKSINDDPDGLDVSGWDVSKCLNIGSVFYNCSALTALDTSGWIFSSTGDINIGSCFYGCTKLVTIGDTSGWNTDRFSTLSGTFFDCKKLKSIDADVNGLDVSTWNLSNCNNLTSTFTYCLALTTLDVSGWDVSKVVAWYAGNNSGTFHSCSGLTLLDTSAWRFSTTTSFSFQGVFALCSNLTTVGNISGWNVGKITNIGGLFYGCALLASVDVSSWTLSECTNISSLFYGCSALTSIVGIANLSLSVCTLFSYVFYGCSSLTSIDISGWNMAAATATAYMFNGCSSMTSLTLPSSLPRVDEAFAGGCSALATYNFYSSTSPTVSGTPFGNYNTADNVHLHVPSGSTSYNTAPWTTDAIFDQPISFDL